MGTDRPRGLTLDAGALIGLERNDRRAWAVLNAVVRGVPRTVTVPAPALAQVWRGDGHPNLARALRGCTVDPLTDDAARRAGTLCGRTGTADVVDAAVMVSAAGRGDTVVTSDPGDLARLAQVLPTVRVVSL
jgi:hypothetical protein